jgi:hypothetical protein
MASSDPGLGALNAPAEDPLRRGVEKYEAYEEERPVAPDQFDDNYITTKAELYAWYWYVGLFICCRAEEYFLRKKIAIYVCKATI